MRVMHVNLSPPGKGGIERLLVDFYDHLNDAEFEIGLCILGDESEVGRQLAARGCPLWTMHRRTAGFDWSLYPRLAALMRAQRPDVVHIHGNPGLTFGVPAARWAGVRNIVYTCHFSVSSHSAARHAFLGGLLRLVPVHVAVSQAARQVLVDRYYAAPAGVQVVYNGVDLDRFACTPPATSGPVAIGFCGVFRPEKQLHLLIEAFARLRQRGVPARLLLVGDGPTMAQCRAAAEREGVSSEVEFAGEQTDVRPFVQRMDVFVLPSREEALPVALLEAMALGKAVVASAVGGIPEVVVDSESGLLVPSGDVQRLADALQHLATDPERRRELADNARRRVEARFSLDAMMAQYAAIYRRLAGSVRRPELAETSA